MGDARMKTPQRRAPTASLRWSGWPILRDASGSETLQPRRRAPAPRAATECGGDAVPGVFDLVDWIMLIVSSIVLIGSLASILRICFAPIFMFHEIYFCNLIPNWSMWACRACAWVSWCAFPIDPCAHAKHVLGFLDCSEFLRIGFCCKD